MHWLELEHLNWNTKILESQSRYFNLECQWQIVCGMITHMVCFVITRYVDAMLKNLCPWHMLGKKRKILCVREGKEMASITVNLCHTLHFPLCIVFLPMVSRLSKQECCFSYLILSVNLFGRCSQSVNMRLFIYFGHASELNIWPFIELNM